ncbi:hypothetical protein [Sphingobacterium sp. SYP-B4668]|uniref:hypothetical protein n=1 Tax=Sphingobacterium sp. SYP-B4668 TaxID=2996035 RepID=UPI0022DD8B58|nr:hypothetical protein [Sphingobacterium sp. SYP-B4668]
MKNASIISFAAIALLFSCQAKDEKKDISLIGSWKLVESKTIKGKDTTQAHTDTTKSEMVKMFNATDFAFFNHDKKKGTDSAAFFVSGSGRYALMGNAYQEELIYCSFREWEGKKFDFELHMAGDTLIQSGIEHIPELGVNQKIIEKYIRIR